MCGLHDEAFGRRSPRYQMLNGLVLEHAASRSAQHPTDVGQLRCTYL